jgi:phenylalanyl-tRNA synthetase beta chain
MLSVDLDWLRRHVEVPDSITLPKLAQALVKVGIEEESIRPAEISGGLVVGEIVSFQSETHSNGKTILWCEVEVGESKPRGIVCGATNIEVGQKVAVALPGAILPGGMTIGARKTYGHISEGMICSESELGLASAESDAGLGIMDLSLEPVTVGQDAADYLGLNVPVLEVNITPDRGYQYSYRGIAREFHHATELPFVDRVAELKERVPDTSLDAYEVILGDNPAGDWQVGCSRFVTRIVEGLDPKALSPRWLKNYLRRAGMRSISLAVDISNYVMLDLGQPLHCYDFDSVFEPLVVRRAVEGETLITLDQIERRLSIDDLLICDSPPTNRSVVRRANSQTKSWEGAGLGTDSRIGSRIIGLAGVMGGQETEIRADTNKVLIEAAWFDPIAVARTSKRHKIPSEAARRFERFVDWDLQAAAAQWCAELLVRYGGQRVRISERVGDVNVNPPRTFPVTFNIQRVQQILGVNIPESRIREILQAIGCKVWATDSDNWQIQTPSWRSDLLIDADFVEEIGRILGYDQIPSAIPSPKFNLEQVPGLSRSQKMVRDLANAAVGQGFTEVLSYPFVGAEIFEKLQIPPDDPRSYLVKLANPLADQRGFLRSEVLQTLIEIAQRNLFRGNANFKLFEIGLTYCADPRIPLAAPGLVRGIQPDAEFLAQIAETLPAQALKFAGVIHGDELLATPLNSARKVDWTSGFSVLDLLAMVSGRRTFLDAQPLGFPYHPERSGRVITDDKTVGEIGELHPQVSQNLQLHPRTVVFEINLNSLFLDMEAEAFPVQPVSRFPLVKQDFSFLVDVEQPVLPIEQRIAELLGDELEEIVLLDVFRGSSIPAGKKSVTYALKIRSQFDTLHPDQILNIREKIIHQLNLPDVELRS